MSTSAAASRRREWWPAFGHNAWKIEMAAMVGWVAALALPLEYQTWTTRALIILWFVANLAQWKHDSRLCEKCISAMPLDPQTEIVKHARALRAIHWVTGKRHKWLVIGALVVYVAAVMLLPRIPSSILSAVGILATGVLWGWSVQVHKRLQPWCPQCRHGGRGKDTFNPEPVPPETHERDEDLVQ